MPNLHTVIHLGEYLPYAEGAIEQVHTSVRKIPGYELGGGVIIG